MRAPGAGDTERRDAAAWIIARPLGSEAEIADRLFTELGELVGAERTVVPHLTVEIVYPPLPDREHLAARVAAVARKSTVFRVPAVGVYFHANFLTVRLALSAELLALRRHLADAIVDLGGVPYPETENWRPHLSVAQVPEEVVRGADLSALLNAVAGYTFPTESLVLSLAGDSPDIFREIGPFALRR